MVKPSSGDRSVKIQRALEKENKLLTSKLKYLTKDGVMLKREHNFVGNFPFSEVVAKQNRRDSRSSPLSTGMVVSSWKAKLGEEQSSVTLRVWHVSGAINPQACAPAAALAARGSPVAKRSSTHNLGSWKRMSRCVSRSWHHIKKQIRTRGFLRLFWLQAQASRKGWHFMQSEAFSEIYFDWHRNSAGRLARCSDGNCVKNF